MPHPSPIEPALRRSLTVPPVDLIASLRWHRVGFGDPGVWSDAQRYAVAFRARNGPCTLLLEATSRTTVSAALHGPGSEEASRQLLPICGAEDDPEGLLPLTAALPRLNGLVRRQRLVRMARVPWLYELGLGTVLQQRVDFESAAKAYAELSKRYGEPAPGDLGLRLVPSPGRLLSLQSHAFRELGVDGQRERALRAFAEAAPELFDVTGDPVRARALLSSIAGFGPWTVESMLAFGLGDADAVPTFDYWLPHLVGHALVGKARSTDEEMLRLLEPYRPHRYRLIKVLYASGFDVPRFGPRRRRTPA